MLRVSPYVVPGINITFGYKSNRELEAEGAEILACEIMSVDRQKLKGSRGKGDIPLARFFVMWALRSKGWTLQAVADHLGRKTSTVLLGVRALEDMVSTDKNLHIKFEAFKNSFSFI